MGELTVVLGERLRAADAAVRLAYLIGAHELAVAHEVDRDNLIRIAREHDLLDHMN